eukprot:1066002-Pelagomonas_calceolata.AAC.2
MVDALKVVKGLNLYAVAAACPRHPCYFRRMRIRNALKVFKGLNLYAAAAACPRHPQLHVLALQLQAPGVDLPQDVLLYARTFVPAASSNTYVQESKVAPRVCMCVCMRACALLLVPVHVIRQGSGLLAVIAGIWGRSKAADWGSL